MFKMIGNFIPFYICRIIYEWLVTTSLAGQFSNLGFYLFDWNRQMHHCAGVARIVQLKLAPTQHFSAKRAVLRVL